MTHYTSTKTMEHKISTPTGDMWFDWEQLEARNKYKKWREFAMYNWIENGRPNTIDEGVKVTYPDGFVITMDAFYRGEYT